MMSAEKKPIPIERLSQTDLLRIEAATQRRQSASLQATVAAQECDLIVARIFIQYGLSSSDVINPATGEIKRGGTEPSAPLPAAIANPPKAVKKRGRLT